jgi:imidazole glycerol-phosphate synthase subunit HisF
MAYIGKTRTPSYFFQADEMTQDLAKRMRCNMTPCEKLLWQQLRAKNIAGAKFRRQHPIKFYIADFYCHEARLVIEVDGPIHAIADQSEHDINRDAEMDRLGIKTLRFKNDEIINHMGTVLKLIKESVIIGRDAVAHTGKDILPYSKDLSPALPLEGRETFGGDC